MKTYIIIEAQSMRGVEKPVQAGCTFDAAHIQQENPTAGMTKKQRREYENAQKQRAHQEKRMNELAEKFGLELEIRGGIDCDYYSYKLFAAKDGMPFLRANPPWWMVSSSFRKNRKRLSRTEARSSFFCSYEVSFMPLKEAVELWMASGSVQRESVMSLYDEMPTATVSEAAVVVAERNKASLYRGGFGGHHD